MKIISVFINIIYWLGLFISPVLILSFIAVCLYSNHITGIFLSVLIEFAGIISGIAFAEYVRKRHGLTNFYGNVPADPQEDQ